MMPVVRRSRGCRTTRALRRHSGRPARSPLSPTRRPHTTGAGNGRRLTTSDDRPRPAGFITAAACLTQMIVAHQIELDRRSYRVEIRRVEVARCGTSRRRVGEQDVERPPVGSRANATRRQPVLRSSRRPRSSGSIRRRRPTRRSRRPAFCSFSSVRPEIVTCAPSRAGRAAVARPMPLPPPVTNAVAPVMLTTHLHRLVAADEVRGPVLGLGGRRGGCRKRSSSCSNITCSSSRASELPGRSACPNPNATCSLGERVMSNRNGSSNWSSSRFADGYSSSTFCPSRIVSPRSSTSCVAVRAMFLIGVTHRNISSTADGRSDGRAAAAPTGRDRSAVGKAARDHVARRLRRRRSGSAASH